MLRYATIPHCTSPQPSHRRAGVSLLEVVLALGIFVAGLAALSQLHATGTDAAVQARLKTHAILRCESKLNEVSAGVEPLQAANALPFEDDSSWNWSLTSEPGPHADLLQITVTVARNGQSSFDSASFSLSRLIRDPLVFQQATTTDQGTTP